MKVNYSITTTLLLFWTLICHAQYKRLHVGDTLTKNVVFNQVRNYSGISKSLADFKDKYIILDFWDRYCTACIAAFPKMQKLQEQFKDQVTILLVTKDSEKDLEKLFITSPILKRTTLPMVLHDSVLNDVIFPHETVPHHAWLDKNGKVLAVTQGFNANAKNVSNMLLGQNLNFTTKDATLKCDDLNNGQESLLTFKDGIFLKNLCYYNSNGKFKPEQQENSSLKDTSYSFFMSRIDGCSNMTNRFVKLKNKEGKEIGYLMINVPLDFLYRNAYSYFRNIDYAYSGKIIMEPDVPLEAMPVNESQIGLWHFKTSLCFETTLPDYSNEKVFERLRQDLVSFLGIKGEIEEREVNCLVLTQAPDNIKLQYAKSDDPYFIENTRSDHGIVFSNRTIDQLTFEIQHANESYNIEDPIIVNETGIAGNIRLNMTFRINSFQDIPVLQMELQKYGIILKKETRKMKVLVLKKVTK